MKALTEYVILYIVSGQDLRKGYINLKYDAQTIQIRKRRCSGQWSFI